MKSVAFISIALCIVFNSCRKTDSEIITPPPPSTLGVYIVNEGGFSGGGALSYYDKERDSIFNDVVGPLQGWIFPNDMKILNGKGYVTVNGQDKIDVIDLETNQVMHSMLFPQYTGPGFLTDGVVTVDGELMYTANYNGTVSIIDVLKDSVLSTSSPVVGFPGGIAYAGGKILVSDVGYYPAVGTMVKVVDRLTGSVIDSIIVGNGPGTLAVIRKTVFVLCTGTSKIYRLNYSTGVSEDSLQLSGYLSDMTTNGQSLYVLSSDSVTKVSAFPSLQVVQSAVVKRTAGSYFYSLAVDDLNGDIYVSNITTGGGSGQVEIYSANGTLKRPPLPVGVFPGAFAFKR